MTWGLAHGRAMIRATQTHRDLGLDPRAYIDVYQALGRAGLLVFGQPMADLFGAYLPAISGKGGRKAGVVLNTHRSPIDQRHSAAHELGHHVFGHGQCTSDITQVFEDPDPGTWPTREKEAEAFAAAFLMPRTAARKVIELLGIDRITRPDEAYQVALHLGTSYRGTVRHLAAIKLISQGEATRWARVPKATLRNRAGTSLAAPPTGSVWVLGPASDGAVLHVRPGDRLVIDSPLAQGPASTPAALPPGVSRADPASAADQGALALEFENGGPIELDITDAFCTGGPLRLEPQEKAGWQAILAPVPALRDGLNELV